MTPNRIEFRSGAYTSRGFLTIALALAISAAPVIAAPGAFGTAAPSADSRRENHTPASRKPASLAAQVKAIRRNNQRRRKRRQR